MKKNYLITIIVLVLFFLVSACSSQVDTQKQKKQALAKTGISESDSIDSDMDSSKNLRLWVWSELGSNQAEPEIKEIIRDNKIIAQTVYGSDDLAVLYDSFLMVEIDLAGIGKDPSELSVEWILQPQNDEPRIILSDPVQKSVRSQGFNIDFTSRFKVSINIIESESIAASQQHSFSVISPGSVYRSHHLPGEFLLIHHQRYEQYSPPGYYPRFLHVANHPVYHSLTHSLQHG